VRGQQGTDGVMPPVWPVGSWFVLIDGAAQQLDMGANMRGVTQHLRVGPAQLPYDDETYETAQHAFDGVGLRPFSPAQLRAEPVGSGDLNISWMRRTRLDGDSWDGEVPLGETQEAYQLRIEKSGTLLRGATTQAPAWTYPAALQSADGATGQITISAAQVSERFGAGPACILDVDI